MNKIFTYISLFCLLIGLLFDRGSVMTDAILKLPTSVLELTLRLIVNGCLWNGFLSLANASGLVNRLSHLLMPIFQKIYPEIVDEKEVLGLISSNFLANFFGLGSLAMLSGLKAMQALDKLNHDQETASRSMKTLIIFNTTGCSLFPMSIISMRSFYKSKNPLSFIIYTLVIGIITLTLGITIQKGVERFGR